jgi:hypothetical protein
LPPDAGLPQAAATSGIAPTGQKKTVIALAAIIGILLVALSVLAIFLFTRRPEDSSRVIVLPPPLIDPSVPGIPKTPRPPVPPQPDAPPGNTTTTISQDLIYPGAEITMEVKGEEKAKVVQLSTPDSFDKVVDWYVKKINPTKHVRIPGGNAVLKADDIAVMIMNGGNVTSILITQGKN